MAITTISTHDHCKVHIVYNQSRTHWASLECCDPLCTRKKKFIQWINGGDLCDIEDLGVTVIDQTPSGTRLRNGVKERPTRCVKRNTGIYGELYIGCVFGSTDNDRYIPYSRMANPRV